MKENDKWVNTCDCLKMLIIQVLRFLVPHLPAVLQKDVYVIVPTELNALEVSFGFDV